MKKRSLKIAGHHTSVALEQEFWDELDRLAAIQELSLPQLIETIDQSRATQNLASALRLWVLNQLKNPSG